MRDLPVLLAFNRGVLAKNALARIDLKRTALSAELQTNWMPRVLGSMMLRPGSTHLGGTHADATGVLLPFVYSTLSASLVELTANAMRVWSGDELISRPVVSTSFSNGSFATDLTDWTDADEGSAVSGWGTGGHLTLTGSGSSAAIRRQALNLAAEAHGVEHAINVTVVRGTATLTLGYSVGGSDLGATVLRPGVHSIACTPGSSPLYVQLSATTTATTWISDIAIAPSGPMVLATPWGAGDLANVRGKQSASVLFACDGAHSQRRIERQGARSWSVVEYETSAGPFRPENITPITLTASGLTGSILLSASASVFDAGHIGALFRLTSAGQNVTKAVTAGDQWTSDIRVTGIGTARAISVILADQASASTATLQRSVGAPGDWAAVTTYSGNGTTTYNDGLDNQIVYYRLGAASGATVADPYTVTLSYAAGSLEGIARVVQVSTSTSAFADVVRDMGSTTATPLWSEGRWSSYRGYPSAVALHDGRLWWAGGDNVSGSVSDAYANYDDAVEGDSGPISRSLSSGPVDKINWMVSLSQLLLGTEGSELTARASSLDEPLTPTAFSLRAVSTQGSARLPAVRVDTSALFVQRNGYRVLEVALGDNQYTYATKDLTAIAPDIGAPGIVRLAVQRQPDTRIHCVREDGTVALLVYDRAEEVNCWVTYETDGAVEDVAVLPGVDEDAVYYLVRRTINGATKRSIERWALEAEGLGGAVTKLADCGRYAAGPATVVAGLYHLEGETVCAWGNGKDLGTYTVASGSITLPESATNVFVGLPYTAQFKSSKIMVSTSQGTVALSQPKQPTHVGLVLSDTHPQGLRYGQDFAYLDELPAREGYADVDPDIVRSSYEEQTIPINGSWGVDARLCLEAASPRPCTVLACVVDITGHVK